MKMQFSKKFSSRVFGGPSPCNNKGNSASVTLYKYLCNLLLHSPIDAYLNATCFKVSSE